VKECALSVSNVTHKLFFFFFFFFFFCAPLRPSSPRGHLHCAPVLRVRNAEVVGVNIHELELKVRYPLRVLALEQESELLPLVLGLEGYHVVVVGALEDLAEVGGVEAEGDVAVAPVVVEAVAAESDDAEGDVGGVHRLDGHALGGAVDVGVGDELGGGGRERETERKRDGKKEEE